MKKLNKACLIHSYSSSWWRSWPIREQSFINLHEHMDDYPVMVMRVQGQKTLQQMFKLLYPKYLLLHNHLHHRRPEIIVRIARSLHHRKTVFHLPTFYQRQHTHFSVALAPGAGARRSSSTAIFPAMEPPSTWPRRVWGETLGREERVCLVFLAANRPPPTTIVRIVIALERWKSEQSAPLWPVLDLLNSLFVNIPAWMITLFIVESEVIVFTLVVRIIRRYGGGRWTHATTYVGGDEERRALLRYLSSGEGVSGWWHDDTIMVNGWLCLGTSGSAHGGERSRLWWGVG